MTRPLLLGHRGARASRYIPENTLASFELCLQHGCDGFEFDVRRSADGVAVVCHDPETEGMEIARTTARVLALPTLEAVLHSFGSRAFLDIELKVGGLETELIGLLQSNPPQKGCVVSSFLPEVLVGLNDLDSSVPLGFLCENADESDLWRGLPVAWLIPNVKLVDHVLIRDVHATGKRVMVWTVNGADYIRQLTEWGVDGIISDRTDMMAASVSSC